jgi:Protein of unknown function (DUF3365)
MTKLIRNLTVFAVFGASLAVMLTSNRAPISSLRAEEPKEDDTLKRARREIKMLDDLYKTAVISVTEIYPKGAPAIMVAMKVYKAMEDGKYHSARLVDATGNPLNEANVAKSPFETRAIEAIKSGKPYYEEVVGEGPDRRLLAATLVPAVLDRCASCHGVKKGDLLGFIRYDLRVE